MDAGRLVPNAETKESAATGPRAKPADEIIRNGAGTGVRLSSEKNPLGDTAETRSGFPSELTSAISSGVPSTPAKGDKLRLTYG
jgi:hypothetical protein